MVGTSAADRMRLGNDAERESCFVRAKFSFTGNRSRRALSLGSLAVTRTTRTAATMTLTTRDHLHGFSRIAALVHMRDDRIETDVRAAICARPSSSRRMSCVLFVSESRTMSAGRLRVG